jgi:hypothetical protein
MHQSAMAFIDLNRITMPYKAMGYPCRGITMRWEDHAVGLPCTMLDRVHPLAQRWAAVMPFTGAQAQAHATRLVRCQPADKADGRRSRACACAARAQDARARRVRRTRVRSACACAARAQDARAQRVRVRGACCGRTCRGTRAASGGRARAARPLAARASPPRFAARDEAQHSAE